MTHSFADAVLRVPPARWAMAFAGLAWTASRYREFRQRAAGAAPGALAAERRAWRLAAVGGVLMVAGLVVIALAGAPLPAAPALLGGLGVLLAGGVLWVAAHLRAVRAGGPAA